jgi:hypothetical protein
LDSHKKQVLQVTHKNKAGESLFSLALDMEREDIVNALMGTGLDLSVDGAKILQKAIDNKNDKIGAMVCGGSELTLH